jgi:hypothetical protein
VVDPGWRAALAMNHHNEAAGAGKPPLRPQAAHGAREGRVVLDRDGVDGWVGTAAIARRYGMIGAIGGARRRHGDGPGRM